MTWAESKESTESHKLWNALYWPSRTKHKMNQTALRVPLCWPPASRTRYFLRKDCRKFKFASEDYHLLRVSGEIRLKPSTNQTDYHLLSRCQPPSVWLAYKNPPDVADICSIQVQGQGHTNFKTRTTNDTQIDVNPHSRSEIHRRATTDTPYTLCDFHFPAFLRGSVAVYIIHLQSNTSCC